MTSIGVMARYAVLNGRVEWVVVPVANDWIVNPVGVIQVIVQGALALI